MSGQDETTNSTTKLNAELLAMVRIASSILQYSKLDDILTTVTRELAQLIQFDRSSVALLAPDQKSLLFHPIYAGAGEAGRLGEARRVPLNEKSATGWVVLNRRAIIRGDIAADGRFFAVVGDE